MIGFPLGLLWANAGEWMIHKYLLHDMGKSKDSFWAFHWHEHHRESRLNDMLDENYERDLFDGLHAQSRAAGLAVAAALHLPLLPIAPAFTAGVWASIGTYYVVHKKSHQDPEWGRKYLRWHYDHHMGRNQHANWCVTWPLFDHLMGTREPYAGTEREAKDRARRAQVKARRAARADAAPAAA